MKPTSSVDLHILLKKEYDNVSKYAYICHDFGNKTVELE